jgi:hypothetical protein
LKKQIKNVQKTQPQQITQEKEDYLIYNLLDKVKQSPKDRNCLSLERKVKVQKKLFKTFPELG